MGIALLGSMMLFGCRKIGETAPETASAGTSYVSEETAGESKTETKATESPVPTEDPAPEPLVPEAIEPTPAEDALPEGMVKSYLTGEPVAEVQEEAPGGGYAEQYHQRLPAERYQPCGSDL